MKGERSWKQAGKAVQKCSKIAAIKLAQQQKKTCFGEIMQIMKYILTFY